MQPESQPPTERVQRTGTALSSMRTRLSIAWALIALGAVLAFSGFLATAVGVFQPVALVLNGVVILNSLVAWGIVLSGVGAVLAVLGAAVRALSRDWSDMAYNVPPAGPQNPMRKCPSCGVHTWMNVCPECGHSLDTRTGR